MGGSEVPLVGTVLADAGQDFSAFDEVLVVADVAVNVTMIFIQNLFDRQLALECVETRDSDLSNFSASASA